MLAASSQFCDLAHDFHLMAVVILVVSCLIFWFLLLLLLPPPASDPRVMSLGMFLRPWDVPWDPYGRDTHFPLRKLVVTHSLHTQLLKLLGVPEVAWQLITDDQPKMSPNID